MKPRLEVVGAVITCDGLVLCTQRGSGPQQGRWEFPGGKVEPGETPRAALVREIREELGCSVQVGTKLRTTEHEDAAAWIVLTTFHCTLQHGEPTLSEHTAARWLPPADLLSLDWAPADLPTVRQLADEASTV